MSDLQLALIAVGAIVIALVLLYNWWQERRFSRDAAQRLVAPESDPLMDTFNIDPQSVSTAESPALETPTDMEAQALKFSDPPSAETLDTRDVEFPEIDVAVETVELEGAPIERSPHTMDEEAASPALEEEEISFEPVDQPPWDVEKEEDAAVSALPTPELETLEDLYQAAAASTLPLPAALDLHIDLVGMLHFAAPQRIAHLQQQLQPASAWEKSAQWLAYAQETGIWHRVEAAVSLVECTDLACGLQLADRAGPVSGATLQAFQAKVEGIAGHLGCAVDWLGDRDPQRFAQHLDQFCIQVDVMVNMHILPGENGPFAGTKLRGLAEAQGMKLLPDGKFHALNEAGETLFMLANHDQRPMTAENLRTSFLQGIALQLDVPRAGDGIEPFNQMALLARQLESSLYGRLVDDNRRMLGDSDIEKIRQHLKSILARMDERGIAPGGATALRLFS